MLQKVESLIEIGLNFIWSSNKTLTFAEGKRWWTWKTNDLGLGFFLENLDTSS